MSIHRKCSSNQPGDYIQRGKGVGGVLRSLYNRLLPIAKNTGEKILSSPEATDTLAAVRDSAIDAGINIVLDKAAGKSSSKSVRKNVDRAKNEIVSAAKSNVRRAVKRTLSDAMTRREPKRSEKDIFDDDSMDE